MFLERQKDQDSESERLVTTSNLPMINIPKIDQERINGEKNDYVLGSDQCGFKRNPSCPTDSIPKGKMNLVEMVKQ